MSRHVVVVAPWLPLPADFGGALRTFHLVRELARRDEVTLLCPARSDELPRAIELGTICNVTTVPATWTPRHPASLGKRLLQFRSIGSRQSFLEKSTWSTQLQRVLDRLFLTTQVDLVHYESTRMALFRPPTATPTVIDAHDIEMTLLTRVAHAASGDIERALKLAEARKVSWLERRLWAGSDLAIATSDRDAAAIEASTGQIARVVPNGVDVASFSRPSDWARRHDIVFTGVMRHQPNSDAARWYLDEIHPLVQRTAPDVRVVFAGADPPSWLLDRATNDVVVTGRVADIRPWIWSAAVAIVPLRSGGGTRLKIFEALAAGTPLVSTTIGAEGINGIADAILCADDPAAFARAVGAILSDETLATRLSENGRRLVGYYDWGTIGNQLASAHDEAVERFVSKHRDSDTTPLDWSGRLWKKG